MPTLPPPKRTVIIRKGFDRRKSSRKDDLENIDGTNPASINRLDPEMIWKHDESCIARGTIGAGEVIEAIRDPEKAENFAQRIDELIGQAAAENERVSGRESQQGRYFRNR